MSAAQPLPVGIAKVEGVTPGATEAPGSGDPVWEQAARPSAARTIGQRRVTSSSPRMRRSCDDEGLVRRSHLRQAQDEIFVDEFRVDIQHCAAGAVGDGCDRYSLAEVGGDVGPKVVAGENTGA